MVTWAVSTFPLSSTLPSARLHFKDLVTLTFLGPSSGAPGLSHLSRGIFMHTLLLCEARTLHYLANDLLEFTRLQMSASQGWLLPGHP